LEADNLIVRTSDSEVLGFKNKTRFSAAGTTQPAVDFQNREIGVLLTRIAANKHIE